jgi:hypothetical protein
LVDSLELADRIDDRADSIGADPLARPPRQLAAARIGSWIALLLPEQDIITFTEQTTFVRLSTGGLAIGALVSTVGDMYGYCIAASGEILRRVIYEGQRETYVVGTAVAAEQDDARGEGRVASVLHAVTGVDWADLDEARFVALDVSLSDLARDARTAALARMPDTITALASILGGDGPTTSRVDAARQLGAVAHEGIDIRAAFSAVNHALEASEHNLREEAARIYVRHARAKKPVDPGTVMFLGSRLIDSSPLCRSRIAQSLLALPAEVDLRPAAAALTGALCDPVPQVRCYATLMVKWMLEKGHALPAVVEPLTALVSDEDPDTQEAARGALEAAAELGLVDRS